jgi:glycerophosphoryl diester phosphodiesterase
MSPRPLLLGHRGARANKSFPENTLASFDQALADGCDGFEFDVRLTADGGAVVCHDPTVGRLEIARARAEQVSMLPRLGEVLERYASRAFLDIELKVSGLERTVTALLRQFPPMRRYVVSSFLPEVLLAMYAQDAAIPLGLICENRAQLGRWPELPVQFVIPRRDLVREGLVVELHKAGRKVFVWTVNVSEEMKRFADWGVDGIISDETKLLAETLGSSG